MSKLLWLDLETTGLDENYHTIIEVGAILTDGQLNEIGRFQAVVHVSDAELNKMNDICWNMHTGSGLVQEIYSSKKDLNQVEQEILAFIRDHVYNNETLLLAGNSIHFDRKFISRHMKGLHKRLHYRMIDVSSFKEALKTFHDRELPKVPPAHRSIPDVEGSISEYRQYMGMMRVA